VRVESLSIRDLLHAAADRLKLAGLESARLEARILLAHAMGVSRDDLIAAIRPPSRSEAELFESLIVRRLAREPVAYIIGRKEFWSLDFRVGPGVLVPRPESETLIEAALAEFPDRDAAIAIADLGTGSGALLAAGLKEFPKACGVGFEQSPQALAYARTNLRALGFAGCCELVGEDWSNAGAGRFDLIFSNPPYIPSGEIAALSPEVGLYEPRSALDGGRDGLDAYRSLASLLPRLLNPGGVAVLELGQGQAGWVERLFQNLTVLRIVPDLTGIPRALVLKKPN
jgi:release factor glutamine methyltransferase